MSVINWIAAGSGDWDVPSNWDAGRVPGGNDDAMISTAGITVTHSSSAPDSVRSLTSQAAINLSGGSLALGPATSTINAALTVGNAGFLSLGSLGTTTLGGSGTLSNAGTVLAQTISAINLPLTTSTGSILRVQATSSTVNHTLTIFNGFTNNGTIELTNGFNGSRNVTLAVANGTLVNAMSGSINSLPGANSAGQRSLNAELNNQGSMSVMQDLDLSRASAAHVNSGTMTVASGHFLTVNGGSFAPGTGISGTLLLNTVTVGSGTIGSTATFVLTNSTVDQAATLVNQGMLVTHGDCVVLGTLTNMANGVLRVEATSGQVTHTLTFLNSFTNSGTLQLTNNFNGSRNVTLSVVNGTLVNAMGGMITTLPGANAGGARTLNAVLDNQGTITVSQATTITADSADLSSHGTINLSGGGDLAITLTGITPSFTNFGTMTIAANQSITVNGGTFNQSAGAITGAGTLVLNGTTANFTTNFSTAVAGLAVYYSTVNGPGTVTNSPGSTLTIFESTITAALVNQGTLVAQADNNLAGTFSNAANAMLSIRALSSPGSATLAVRNGFTNSGTIDLTNTVNTSRNVTLSVVNGTLVNAMSGTITTSPGANSGGARTLAAQINNQGAITASQPTTITKASAVQTNSGTINAAGANLTISQTGFIPRFINTGTLTAGSGWTLTISGGTLTQNAPGTVNGTGTLALSSVTATFNTAVVISTLAVMNSTVTHTPALGVVFTLSGSTYTSPAAVTVAGGATSTILNSTINAPLNLQGTLQAQGNDALNGAVTTASSATLRLQGISSVGSTTLTVLNGFTNNGAIELTNTLNGARNVTLVVSNGTLVNALGGMITTLPGANVNGTRTLTAQINNQGTITISQPTTIGQASAAQSNSGTITVTDANLTINQSGTTPSFTNTGTLTVGDSRTLTINGGSLTQNAPGTVTGNGTLALSSVTATFNTAAVMGTLSVTNSTITHTPALAAVLSLNNSTYTSSAAVTEPTGSTATFLNSTLNAPLNLQGTLQAQGNNALNGAVTTVAGATLRLQGVSTPASTTLTVLNGFTNNGAIELTNTLNGARNVTLVVTNGTLVNAMGGTITTLPGANVNGTRTLTAQVDNQDTIIISQATTISQLTNESSANLTLQNGANLSSPADFSNAGAVTINAGSNFTANTYTQSGGTLTLGGATLTAATVTLNGGMLTGSGTIAGSLINGATVCPGGTGAAGTLTINGDYTQVSMMGILNIELGGTDPSAFDQLVIGGTANLAGTLNVSLINGFQPNPANPDSFVILNFGAVNGDFEMETGLDLGGGNSLVPSYGANTLTLTATSSGGNPGGQQAQPVEGLYAVPTQAEPTTVSRTPQSSDKPSESGSAVDAAWLRGLAHMLDLAFAQGYDRLLEEMI